MDKLVKPSPGPACAFSLRHRLASLGYAASGLILLVRREPNAQLHLVASLIVFTSGITFQVSVADWCWLTGAMAAVWMAEAFNTAIEVLCDRASQGSGRWRGFDHRHGRSHRRPAGFPAACGKAPCMKGASRLCLLKSGL